MTCRESARTRLFGCDGALLGHFGEQTARPFVETRFRGSRAPVHIDADRNVEGQGSDMQAALRGARQMMWDSRDETGAGNDALQAVMTGQRDRRLQHDSLGLEDIDVERLPFAVVRYKDVFRL